MISILKKLSGDVNTHLWTIESFAMNPLHERKQFGMDNRTIFTSVGEAYIMHKKLLSNIKKIESIQKYCLSEINGTFYNDFEKQWEEFEDCEPEYTTETVYEYILGEWDHHPAPEIDHTIIAFVEVNAEFSTALTGAITKFFPAAGPYKQNAEGKMEKVSALDSQIDDNLKAGAMLANIEEYNERLAKIHHIALLKGKEGTIADILHLIGE
jgi:hypothetical protein